MSGLTEHEKALAIAAQGPGTGIGLALAEVSLYWDNHLKSAPDVHDLRINIKISNEGTAEQRIAAVKAVADWLGVGVEQRYGTHFAQRRFGTAEDSIIVEAHFTPDQDAAHAERVAAKEAAGREPVGAAA